MQSLIKQRDVLVSKIMELEVTLDSISELDKSDGEILFSIGGEAYKTGMITDKDKLIVEIGANVALEKSAEEGKAAINKRKGAIENSVNLVQQEILKISETMRYLEPEIQDMAKRLQQAG